MLQICTNNSAYIDKFAIYGERHSGTNFLENSIRQTFGLDITHYYGGKHFFGWAKPETITYRGKHTLFIGIVRNPYDWIMACYEQPHHWDSNNRKKTINSFLLEEWYSVRDIGGSIMEDTNFITKCRYKNIFDMRTTKYKYLCNIMPTIASNYVLLSYDTFLKNYHNYMNIISNRFYLKKQTNNIQVWNKQPYFIPEDFKKIIDDNCDWELEASLGFFKR